jgi:hypothetical protein
MKIVISFHFINKTSKNLINNWLSLLFRLIGPLSGLDDVLHLLQPLLERVDLLHHCMLRCLDDRRRLVFVDVLD